MEEGTISRAPDPGDQPLQILEAQRIRMPNSRQSQITRAGQIEFNNKHEARYKTGPQSSSRNVFIRLGRGKGMPSGALSERNH